MAMDGIALGAVITECQLLVGGRIDKVQQPEKDLLLFTVRSNAGTQKLLVCTHAENGRIQITGRAFDNPQNAPAFCMLLRRRLTGGRICSIRQLGADRVCEIIILARNDLFDEVSLRLIVEITGKHANLILLEPNGAIVDCLRRISANGDHARILLPGFPYEPIPAQEKQNPFTAPVSAFEPILVSPDPARAMTAAFEGVSRQSANALLSVASSAESLRAMMQSMKNGAFSPCVAFNADGEPAAALPFQPQGLYARIEPMSSMNEALERYYADRDRIVGTRRRSGALRSTVSSALSRTQNKYAAFLDSIRQTEAFETARVNGELILANLHLARPGMSELVVDDYFVDPPVKRVIALDPAFNAQDNAKRYFKQYRKGKLGKAYAEGQIETLEREIQYLEGQLENIEKCDTLYELSEIREELVRERYLRPDKAQQAKPAKKTVRANAVSILGRHCDLCWQKQPPERRAHVPDRALGQPLAARKEHSRIACDRRLRRRPAGEHPARGGDARGLLFSGTRILRCTCGLHAEKVCKKTVRVPPWNGHLLNKPHGICLSGRCAGANAPQRRVIATRKRSCQR